MCKNTQNGLLQIRSTEKVQSLVFLFVTSSRLVAGHHCFGRTFFQYFWGRNEWGLYVIGLCRKCHKSDQGAQIDWPVRALRRVGEIWELSRPIAVMNWEKNSLSELCVYACACFVSVILMFHCIKLLIINFNRMKVTPYWMQQILESHVK
jgi:hypothetical protein